MELQEKLNCFGLLGFASGWEWGRANIKPDEKLDGRDGYCAKTCPRAALCLTAHRTRAKLMFPRATRHFDKVMARTSQTAATMLWRKEHPQTPIEPYALLLVMNHEDGLEAAKTGKPKDRGALTLKWPRN